MAIDAPDPALVRVDLEFCRELREIIIRRLIRLDQEGSVRASYVEKLEQQVAALDRWIERYEAQL